MQRLGVIGGTGLIKMSLSNEMASSGLSLIRNDDVNVETKWGEVPLKCMSFKKGDENRELIFLQRHHNGNMSNKPPHKINHKANIMALKDSGCEAILAVCSVGAISSELPPGKVVLANQYIDFTGVESTFHDEEAVFTSVTEPFSSIINSKLEKTLRNSQNLDSAENLFYTYWIAHGPHFETRAEIDAIEKLGGHMVGMTMPREAKLACELEIPYVAVCISSNWAAGREPGDSSAVLNHKMVSSTANDKLGPVWDCLIELLS
tara:strand:+ start:411 stop:1196 length:786 start_codon:yes stop_codon:yes gene_type:complete